MHLTIHLIITEFYAIFKNINQKDKFLKNIN